MVPGLMKPDSDPVFGYLIHAYEPMLPAPLAGRMVYRRKPD
jgi:hypothetical protein